MNVQDNIKRIELSKKNLINAIRDCNTASKPQLTNIHLVKEIYEIYKNTVGGNIMNHHRKEFIFVVIYLYDPMRLFGGKIKSGLREKIGEVLGVKSKNVISNFCSELLVLYRHYSDFREHVDITINNVMDIYERKEMA